MMTPPEIIVSPSDPPDSTLSAAATSLLPQPNPRTWNQYIQQATEQQLRGTEELTQPIPVTLSLLAKHKEWIAVSGKVYNIEAYLKYHPGGEKILKPMGGKDGTEKFSM